MSDVWTGDWSEPPSRRSQENELGDIQVEVLAKSGSSWDGASLPCFREGSPEISVLRIIIPPGVRLPLHKHPAINVGVLLKGELTLVSADQKTFRFEAGDAIIEVVDTWHYSKNCGDEPVELLVFYVGVQGEPITVKASDVSPISD